jgi:hypothetical protein
MLKPYLCIISVLTSVYEETIIASLVKKGYAVSKAYPHAEVTIKSPANLSSVVSLKLETDEDKKIMDVHKDVATIMMERAMMYHSITVVKFTDAVWCASNIVIENKAPESPVTPPIDKKNVN